MAPFWWAHALRSCIHISIPYVDKTRMHLIKQQYGRICQFCWNCSNLTHFTKSGVSESRCIVLDPSTPSNWTKLIYSIFKQTPWHSDNQRCYCAVQRYLYRYYSSWLWNAHTNREKNSKAWDLFLSTTSMRKVLHIHSSNFTNFISHASKYLFLHSSGHNKLLLNAYTNVDWSAGMTGEHVRSSINGMSGRPEYGAFDTGQIFIATSYDFFY